MQSYIGIEIIQAEPKNRVSPPDSSARGGMIEYGYKIIYDDGHETWEPKEKLAGGNYRPINGGCMSFGLAIEAMKLGKKVRRNADFRGAFLCVQKPDTHSLMTEPYIRIVSYCGKLTVPWIPKMDDMLADDWEIVD